MFDQVHPWDFDPDVGSGRHTQGGRHAAGPLGSEDLGLHAGVIMYHNVKETTLRLLQ